MPKRALDRAVAVTALALAAVGLVLVAVHAPQRAGLDHALAAVGGVCLAVVGLGMWAMQRLLHRRAVRRHGQRL